VAHHERFEGGALAPFDEAVQELPVRQPGGRARVEECLKVSDDRIHPAALHHGFPSVGPDRPLLLYYRAHGGFIHFFLFGAGLLGGVGLRSVTQVNAAVARRGAAT
jgi:hypothetical protein